MTIAYSFFVAVMVAISDGNLLLEWGDSNHEHFPFLCSFCWQPNESPSLNGNTAFTLQNSRKKIEQIQVNRSWFECPDYKKSVLVSLKNKIICQIFYFLSKISTMYWKYSKKNIWYNFSSPCLDVYVPKMWYFTSSGGTKQWNQKEETGNDWDVISEHLLLLKTDFSVIF